jgi:N-acetylglutamate synthase-like GNAT family acetyltransferase
VTYEVRLGDYLVSTEPTRLDFDVVHAFLTNDSYWAEGISRQRFDTAVEHSLPFGVYRDDEQVGFARVITDFSTFAFLADVFVHEPDRGKGASKALLEGLLAHPKLSHIRRWMLGTKDAHTLYAKFGFVPVEEPARWMELSDSTSYTRDIAS